MTISQSSPLKVICKVTLGCQLKLTGFSRDGSIPRIPCRIPSLPPNRERISSPISATITIHYPLLDSLNKEAPSFERTLPGTESAFPPQFFVESASCHILYPPDSSDKEVLGHHIHMRSEIRSLKHYSFSNSIFRGSGFPTGLSNMTPLLPIVNMHLMRLGVSDLPKIRQLARVVSGSTVLVANELSFGPFHV